MKDFKDIQIGDILESWYAGNRESCCVIAKKTEIIFNNKNELQEITTLKVVNSYGDNIMSVETINDEFGNVFYKLTDHYNLNLE